MDYATDLLINLDIMQFRYSKHIIGVERGLATANSVPIRYATDLDRQIHALFHAR